MSQTPLRKLFCVEYVHDSSFRRIGNLSRLNLNETVLIDILKCHSNDINIAVRFYIVIEDDDHYNIAKKLRNFHEL